MHSFQNGCTAFPECAATRAVCHPMCLRRLGTAFFIVNVRGAAFRCRWRARAGLFCRLEIAGITFCDAAHSCFRPSPDWKRNSDRVRLARSEAIIRADSREDGDSSASPALPLALNRAPVSLRIKDQIQRAGRSWKADSAVAEGNSCLYAPAVFG